MSKFQILNDSYGAAYIEFRRYVEECRDFLGTLARDIGTYLEMPADRIQFLQLRAAEPTNPAKTLQWMVPLPDGFMHAQIGLTFSIHPNIAADGMFTLDLAVKRLAEEFVVVLVELDEEHRIPVQEQDAALKRLHEAIFKGIKEYFDTWSQALRDGKGPPEGLQFIS